MKPFEFFVCLGICIVVSALVTWALIQYFNDREMNKGIADAKAKGPIGFGPSSSSTAG